MYCNTLNAANLRSQATAAATAAYPARLLERAAVRHRSGRCSPAPARGAAHPDGDRRLPAQREPLAACQRAAAQRRARRPPELLHRAAGRPLAARAFGGALPCPARGRRAGQT
eukprot:5112578-Prymnesium_polylepis.1